ncbi:MAG: NAD(P)-dependent alcohol dehydrogenase, partial [Candidatus Nitrosopolaris sp.]
MIQVSGYAAQQAKAPLAPYAFERREPREHDIVIDIQYCGICHTDIHQVRNEWGASTFPMIPGHEIAGIVTGVGSKATRYQIGDRVAVGCFVDSCRKCGPCRQGLEQYCTEGPTLTYNSLERDGQTRTQGGYSDKIVVDEDYILRLADNVSLDRAAPLLCAGITMYSPLIHWNAGPGKKVGIIGLGGLGHMGVKIADALGSEVSVLSHSLKKQEDGLKMGADKFYATSDHETFKNLRGYFDLIINTLAIEIQWDDYLNLLDLNGTMV